MSRYSQRSATSGAVTLNSARKGRNTLQFWFFRKIGKKWVEFDVRQVAKVTGTDLPPSMTTEELNSCGNCPGKFEHLLLRDLQATADWCARVDPDGAIAELVAI